MNEYVTLLGADDVKSAGHNISSAADTIRSAAGDLEMSVHRCRELGHELLDRLEGILREDREQRRGR